MPLFSLILLGLAVSLDGFGVGIAYGLRNLKIPFTSLIIISLSSALAVLLSMFTGRMFACLFYPRAATLVGGLILVLVGIWIIKQSLLNQKELDEQEEYRTSISLFANLLKEPQGADLDQSGEISPGEAIILGLALAMDAFGAGFGAAMMGFNPFITSIFVGISKVLLVSSGFYLGNSYMARILGERASCLSGFVLILLGVLNLISF